MSFPSYLVAVLGADVYRDLDGFVKIQNSNFICFDNVHVFMISLFVFLD